MGLGSSSEFFVFLFVSFFVFFSSKRVKRFEGKLNIFLGKQELARTWKVEKTSYS